MSSSAKRSIGWAAKPADVADLFDRLSFRRIQVHATSIGQLTHMHVGVMGTMAQMFLSDLREKTRRGQLGRARAGRIPGGLAYGYAVVPPPPGSQEAIIGKDRYGCATRRGKGACDNARTISRQAVGRRGLGGLRERMLTPDLVEEFVRAFEAELAHLRKSAAGNRRIIASKLTDVERRLERVLRAIETGAWSESLQARLSELEQQRAVSGLT